MNELETICFNINVYASYHNELTSYPVDHNGEPMYDDNTIKIHKEEASRLCTYWHERRKEYLKKN